MKLFLLRRCLPDDVVVDPWNPPYDKVFGFVVRAESECAARRLICDSEETGDEGDKVWMSPEFTLCVEITVKGFREIILRDYFGS